MDIIGLDIDELGIGERIVKVASRYGVDNLNALYLTDSPARHSPVGPDDIGGPHRPRYVPGRQQILRADLLGSPV